MKNKIFRVYLELLVAMFVLGALSMSCSHPPLDLPNGTVIVDSSNPKHTIVEFNAACPAESAQAPVKSDSTPAKSQESITENGKTYYFSSEAERDRVMQNFTANSRY